MMDRRSLKELEVFHRAVVQLFPRSDDQMSVRLFLLPPDLVVGSAQPQLAVVHTLASAYSTPFTEKISLTLPPKVA